MKNIDGKNGEKMLELLEQQSKKNGLKISRNATFGEDIVALNWKLSLKMTKSGKQRSKFNLLFHLCKKILVM